MSTTFVRREASDAQAAVPAHVAIIMDGNGRWAASRHLPKIAGHREGARAVRRTDPEAAIQSGVRWLYDLRIQQLRTGSVRPARCWI